MLIQVDSAIQILDFVILLAFGWLPGCEKKRRFHIQTTTFWSLQGPFELTPLRAVTPQAAMDFPETVSVTSSATAGALQSDSKCRCSMMFHDVP